MYEEMMMSPAMSIEQVIERRNQMVDFVRKSMQENIDFGKVPGTEKSTLFKAGAEKLNTFFGFVPRFETITTVEDWTGAEHGGEPFFYYHQKCQLLRDGIVMGEGDGSCNSWEKKYRYRLAQRVCPNCGKPAIFKSRNPGEGYYCWTKKDGCGAKFEENAPSIVSQQAGQVPNPDVFDQVNTLLKMAQKRALVAATLIACNASEFFTQDIEDWAIDSEFRVVETSAVSPQQAAAPRETAVTQPSAAAQQEAPKTNGSKPAAQSESNGHETQRRQTAQRAQPPLSPVQRNKLEELGRILYGDETTTRDELDKKFQEAFDVSMKEATYEQGAKITGLLLTQVRAKTTVQ